MIKKKYPLQIQPSELTCGSTCNQIVVALLQSQALAESRNLLAVPILSGGQYVAAFIVEASFITIG
jgi:hypothetical protein